MIRDKRLAMLQVLTLAIALALGGCLKGRSKGEVTVKPKPATAPGADGTNTPDQSGVTPPGGDTPGGSGSQGGGTPPGGTGGVGGSSGIGDTDSDTYTDTDTDTDSSGLPPGRDLGRDGGYGGGTTPPGGTDGSSSGRSPDALALIRDWTGTTDVMPRGTGWTVTSPSQASFTGGGSSGGSASGNAVTYTGQVQALLERNCTRCHRANGSQSSSPLTSYREVRSFASDVVSRALSGNMPPSGSLSSQDKQILEGWRSNNYAESSSGSGSSGGSTRSPSGGGTSTGGGSQGQGSGDPNIVEFRIRSGTGQGPWNDASTAIRGRVGQSLVFYNDDTVVHQLHTNGAPCPHGTPIQPGGRFVCQLSTPIRTQLYDHNYEQQAAVYLDISQ